MLYFALISYIDPYKDPDLGIEREDMPFLTLIVDAENIDGALDELKKKLIILHDEDESYYDVFVFFLEDLVEVRKIDRRAKVLNWFSVHKFGDNNSLVLNTDPENDPSIIHYSLEDGENELEEGIVEPFLDISRDSHIAQPLFKELGKQKLRGILIGFEELSDGDLYELFVVERCTSDELAELFDLPVAEVDSKRKNDDATYDEESIYSMLLDDGLIKPLSAKKS